MSDFRERALHEAARYGSDPWVFVRELLQNARDAGARSVAFITREEKGVELLACLDDGAGMSYEHAQRFLFRLYASSKEGRRNEAGRFGVGFWSVLRLDPQRITVRSRTRGGEQWAVTLDGQLTSAERVETVPEKEPGTLIVLERAAVPDKPMAPELEAAIRRYGCFLRRKYAPDTSLLVSLNGVPLNAPFTLPAPSATFQIGKMRGVVALGTTPGVELYSRGLWVRSANSLDELLTTPRAGARDSAGSAALGKGLVPRVLLDSDELDLSLSRSDARETKALRKLVRQAQLELSYLIAEQVALARPRTFAQRAGDGFRTFCREYAVPIIVGAALGYAGDLLGLWGAADPRPAETTVAAAPAPAPAARPPGMEPYRDLSASYDAPRIDDIRGDWPTVALHYKPASQPVLISALRVKDLDLEGRAILGTAQGALPYVGPPCRKDCFELEVPIQDGPGALRLPVPAGQRVDVESVTLDGAKVPVLATTVDEPFVALQQPTKGVLRYRTGPGKSRFTAPAQGRPMPEALESQMRVWRTLPRSEAVAAAFAFVHKALRYTNDPSVSYRVEWITGESYFKRQLKVGAGDCDVQNAYLMLALQELGVPARMETGFVGKDGGVKALLHAWVEYEQEDGSVGRLDVSDKQGVPQLTPQAARTEVARATAPAPKGGAAVQSARAKAEASPSKDTGAAPKPQAEPTSVPSPPQGAAASPAQAPTPQAPPSDDDFVTPRRHSRPGAVTDSLYSHSEAQQTSHVRTGVLLFLLFGSGLLLLYSRRSGGWSSLRLDANQRDVSELLRGLIQNPQSFPPCPELFHSRLLARRDGGTASLMDAYKALRKHRLFCARQDSELVQEAQRGGALVLNTTQPEANAVAQALGAKDLDAWTQLFDGGVTTPILEQVKAVFARYGQRWQLRAVPNLRAETQRLQLPGRSATHRAAVSVEADWLIAATALAPVRPHRALFTAVDATAQALSVPDAVRARMLAPLAAAALREEVRG